MDTQIVTGTPDGDWKQLLQAKRVSEATSNIVKVTKNGRLGSDTLKDFLAWFSKNRCEQEIKYVIDATADMLEGFKSVAEKRQCCVSLTSNLGECEIACGRHSGQLQYNCCWLDGPATRSSTTLRKSCLGRDLTEEAQSLFSSVVTRV